MATNITYLLKLDASGAVSSVNALTKSFNQLDKEQQQFAKNAGKISPAGLEAYINDLKKIREQLTQMKPSFNLGKMLAQTTGDVNRASKLLEQRLQQLADRTNKQLARAQAGFGLFAKIEATLASRTPSQIKSDSANAQANYQAKLKADAKLAAALAAQQATQQAQAAKQQATLAKQQQAIQLKQAQANSAAILAQFKANLAAQAVATKAANATALAQAKAHNQQILQASKTALQGLPKTITPANTYSTTPISQIAANPATVLNSLGTQTVNTTTQLTNLQNALLGLINQLTTIPAGVLSPQALAASANAVNQLNNATATLATNLNQLQLASYALANTLNIFNTLKTAAEAAWQSYQNLITGINNYRKGLSQAQIDTLNNVNAIKAEIEERNRLRKAYADLDPLLKQAAKLRQQEIVLNQQLADGYAKYQALRDKAPNNSAGITYVQNLTAAWLAYQNRVQAAMLAVVAQGDAAVKAYEKQQKALEKLQQKGLNWVTGKQVGYERTGQLNQMKASGASSEAIQGQKIRFQLEDIGKAYDKLVLKFQTKVLDPKLDQAGLAKLRADFLAGETALLRQRDAAQKALGEIEKLTKGVHKLDQVHKPFLERIFDLVVGYRLVNAAVNTFTNALRSVPQAGLQYETTYATLKATFSVTSKVNEELKFLDKLAEDAGISIDALRTSFVEFAASAKFSGEKVENINEIFSNISKAGMVLHLPADKMKSAFTALNQMYAKNQVMMEELKRQLGNQLPAAVNIFALSMGKTTRQLMDDMKKGLVVPKETLLNFSRTYAAMFADPASMEYASQGVNAHIQRLSTAWTNFANKIYETSKGAIKGGLSVATEALKFLTDNMTFLTNATLVAGTALGVAFVSHLGAATKALLLARNASAMAAASMITLEAAGTAVAGLSLWANIKMFATNTLLAIPPWLRLVAALATAVVVLKDLEVSVVKTDSTFDKINGKAVQLQKSVTVTDVAIASWDVLLEKATKYWDKFTKWYTENSQMTPLPKGFQLPSASATIDFAAEGFPALAPAYRTIKNIYNAGKAQAEAKALAELQADDAAKAAELSQERVKAALLAGTSGVVDETMAGMNKSVTTALNRIEMEFNRTQQAIKSSTDMDVAKLNRQQANITSAEKSGQLSVSQAMQKQLDIQKKINRLKEEASKKELQALEEKAKKEEALSQSRIDDSVEARKYQEAYKVLGTKQKFLSEMPQALVDTGAYKSIEDAKRDLIATTATNKVIPDKTLESATDLYNATHLDHGFKKLEEVSTKAMEEATKNTVDTWKLYEAKMDIHTNVMSRVSEGVLSTNDILKEEKKLFEEMLVRLPKPVDTSSVMTNQTPVDLAGMKFEGKPSVEPVFVSSGLSAKVEASLKQGYANTAKYDNLIRMFSNQYGVDPKLAKTIMAVESKGINGLTSSAGASGLMQLMPDTAAGLGVKDRTNEAQNIEGGIKLLSQLSKKFNGNVDLIAAGYNAGAASVTGGYHTKSGKYIPPHEPTVPNYTETKDYVKKVKALYQPTASAIKSGETKTEDATAKTLADAKAKADSNRLEAYTNRTEENTKAQEIVIQKLQEQKDALQSSFSLAKTKKENELAKLDNTAFPLSDKKRLEKTASINLQFTPELTKQIDELIKNTQEQISRTADKAIVSGLETDILNLQKERATIVAESGKDRVALALANVIPLQDALERKQFEIQKSLEDSLGIYNEQTVALDQQVQHEEVLKLLGAEKLRLATENNGLSKEEIASKQQLIATTEKHLAQLTQIELIRRKAGYIENQLSAKQGYEEAAARNLPMASAAAMGVSGNFVGSIVAEESARAQSNVLQERLTNFKNSLSTEDKFSAGWYKIKTDIEQTTAAMRELETAKNAVFNQAVNETMDSISNHFVAWANGAETVKDAFRGIAIDFAKMIQEIIMNELKMLAVKGIMSLITGGTGLGVSGGGLSWGGGGGFASGGVIQGFASGGAVSGKGTGTSDSIPSIVPIGSYVLNAKASAKAKRNKLINLSHGEVVLSPDQVANIGLDKLDTINRQGYASGGLVGGSASSSSSAKASGKNSNVYNINVGVPDGTANAQQFGKDVGVEIYKAIAREEAKKELNRYNKLKTGAR